MSDPKPRANPDNRRWVTSWETIAVTALPPGWCNVFTETGGNLEFPCPAILLQEARSLTESWDVPGTDTVAIRRSETRAFDPPFQIRAVFANADGAYLEAVDDISNYVCTIGPGESAPAPEPPKEA